MAGKFLKILNLPTAPTKEDLVLDEIKKISESKNIPNFYDQSGNLIVGAKNLTALNKLNLLFVAHADHPGGIVLNKNKNKLTCEWLGGLNMRLVDQNVLIFNASNGKTFEGVVTEQYEKQRLNKFVVETFSDVGVEISKLGVCIDTPVNIIDGVAYCRGADNLASVAAIGLWLDMFCKKEMPFAFALTRCEEEGRRGANFISTYIQKNIKIISIDVSDRLPGIGLGSGLLIKHGDMHNLFDRKFTNSIVSFCKKIKINYSEVYRTSGENEAGIFSAQNLISSSIGVAIQNYHNFGLFNQTARSEEFLLADLANLISFFSNAQKI